MSKEANSLNPVERLVQRIRIDAWDISRWLFCLAATIPMIAWTAITQQTRDWQKLLNWVWYDDPTKG